MTGYVIHHEKFCVQPGKPQLSRFSHAPVKPNTEAARISLIYCHSLVKMLSMILVAFWEKNNVWLMDRVQNECKTLVSPKCPLIIRTGSWTYRLQLAIVGVGGENYRESLMLWSPPNLNGRVSLVDKKKVTKSTPLQRPFRCIPENPLLTLLEFALQCQICHLWRQLKTKIHRRWNYGWKIWTIEKRRPNKVC